MNILLYYVIILIREYKFIFTRYRGNSGTPPSRSSFPPELTANVQGPLGLCTFAAFWVKNC